MINLDVLTTQLWPNRAVGLFLSVATVGLTLGGCERLGVDMAQRQATAGQIAPPAQAASNHVGRGLNTQIESGQTLGARLTREAQQNVVVTSQSSGIDNVQLWRWRDHMIAQRQDHDPNRRPRRRPAAFGHQSWDNFIPLLATSDEVKLSSDFGWRNLYGSTDFHGAIDLIAPAHVPVISPVTGRVVRALNSGADGGVVILSGERQYSFWHTRPVRGLAEGDWVHAGQPIASIAPWGARTHLHFAIHLTGPVEDPKARNDFNAIDPVSMVWWARQYGLDPFAATLSQGRDMLELSDDVAASLGF